MNNSTVIETTFSGSHTVPGHPLCGERHGHTWRLHIEMATVEKDMDAGALESILGLIRQYHRRDLDRFLPGVDTHPAGLAAFIRERLSDYPVTVIEVMTDDGIGVRAEWVVR